MLHLWSVTTALAVLASVPAISAHGYVSGVVASGTWYPGASPNWIYAPEKPDQAGWYAYNQDIGYVGPPEYSDSNITCHKGATPGNDSIEVSAGESISLQWTEWPESHHGPVLTYLARCHGGDCIQVSAEELKFFKIDAMGLVDGSSSPGSWASDKLIANNNTWVVTIPPGISGNFVLRHEIIALHSAFDQDGEDGAQNYPNCINLKISGSGKQHPCRAGADCRYGTELYKTDDPGILINIYDGSIPNYTIPGPSVWSGLKSAQGYIAKRFIG